MGTAFGFLFWTIFYTVIAVVLDVIFAIVAWLIVRKRNIWRKWLIVLCAALTPTLFIGSEFVLGTIGSFYVSETKGVDWGFGDSWEAPLTQSYELSAIDLPEAAHIYNRDKSKPSLYEGIVQQLWVSEDSIVVTRSKANNYSLLVFYPQVDSASILLHQVDSLQLTEALQCRNLDPTSAMAPNDYFCKTQREAHKVEAPVRHILSFAFVAALWAGLIWFVRKQNKK